MKILFIGGTGTISTACTELAARQGHELVLLRRGSASSHDVPSHVRQIFADIHDTASVNLALGDERFDSIVDWIVFTPEQAARDVELFARRTRQYVFISSASAYQKPQTHYRITESTPLANPYWQYSRDKIACEEFFLRAYREQGFPITIVRPSFTYGDTLIPMAVNAPKGSFTVASRLLRGKKIIVPGDGSSLWTLTHNSDFARGFNALLGMSATIGHAFHITSDEVLSWDQIHRELASALGVEAKIAHISSDFLAACEPRQLGELQGDKTVSISFDNSKIKRFAPGFVCEKRFAEGIRQTVAWFLADPKRQQVDAEADALWDKIIAGYERGLAATIESLSK